MIIFPSTLKVCRRHQRSVIFLNETKMKMVKKEKITNSLTKIKTKTEKMMKTKTTK